MPHPRFKHQWEEDSYWKHYENYKEELALREEENKEANAKAQAKAKAELQEAVKIDIPAHLKPKSHNANGCDTHL